MVLIMRVAFRPTTFFRPSAKYWINLLLVLAVICVGVFTATFPDSWFTKLLSNPVLGFAAGWFVAPIAAVAGFLVNVPIPFFAPPRSSGVLEDDELDAAMTKEGEWTKLSCNFFKTEGQGKHTSASIYLKEPIQGAFFFDMLVLPMAPKGGRSPYWRAGIVLYEQAVPSGPRMQLFMAHIDSHGGVVGYDKSEVSVHTVERSKFESRWTRLGMQVANEVSGFCAIAFRIDGVQYDLGMINPPPSGWRLEIRIWSDQHQYHEVIVGDMALHVRT
jgi:hypothetical protein